MKRISKKLTKDLDNQEIIDRFLKERKAMELYGRYKPLGSMGNFEEQTDRATQMVIENEEFFPDVKYMDQVWPLRTGTSIDDKEMKEIKAAI